MKVNIALVCCIFVTPVTSQFFGFRDETPPLIPGMPMYGPVWMGPDEFMPYPYDMGMMGLDPLGFDPLWSAYQPWPYRSSLLNTWTGYSPTGLGLSSNPWTNYMMLNGGTNTVTGLNTASTGLVSTNYPWNTLATNTQTFPIIPNTVTTNTGGFVNGVNTMNTGLVNTQVPATNLQNSGLVSTNTMGTFGTNQFSSNVPQNGFVSTNNFNG